MQTTTVTLNYGKETLTFGADYTVGVSTPTGRGDAFFGRLERRAKNGDLIFLVDSGGTTRRVATRTLLSIEEDATVETVEPESIVAPRRDGESAVAYLARLDQPVPKGLGAAYVRWIETDPGQRALADAAAETEEARRATRKGRTRHEPLDSFTRDERDRISRALDEEALVLAKSTAGYSATPEDVADRFVENERKIAGPSFNEAIADDLRAVVLAGIIGRRGTKDAKDAFAARKSATAFEDNPTGDPAITSRNRARLREVAAEAIERGEITFSEDQPKRTSGAKPYAERNQVWRCGTCKRRTRQPFCENGHDRVDAPAGKRREDRAS